MFYIPTDDVLKARVSTRNALYGTALRDSLAANGPCMGYEAEIASIAVMDGQKLLMGKRRDTGKWTLPGGHLNPREDPHAGGLRELREETGIEAQQLNSMGSQGVVTDDGRTLMIHAFNLTCGPGTTTKLDPDKEVSEWKWIDVTNGLPKEIEDNLHSKRNVCLYKLGIQKSEEFFVTDLAKARSHKYIERYRRGDHWIYVYKDDEDATKRHHRYDDEDAARLLMGVANRLKSIDEVREQNNVGLNRMDYDRMVTNPPTTVGGLRHMLKKYKRQISGIFGEEEYHLLGLSDEVARAPAGGAQIHPAFHPTYGSMQVPLTGRIAGREDFQKYVQAHRDHGFTFDPASKSWFLHKNKLAAHNHDAYTAKLAEIGVHVHPMPERPEAATPAAEAVPAEHAPTPAAVAEPPRSSMTADDVINGIRNRRIRDKIAVKHTGDGGIEFHSPYSPEFNELFSNRSGALTGITEYRPSDHARITHDLALADEAIAKLKERLPGWEIVEQGMAEAREAKRRLSDEMRLPIPHVASKLAPGMALFPYQNEGVRFLEKTGGNALVGDEMGLGKTLQSLAWVAAHGHRVLVVTPKVVRLTWLQEAVKFFPGHFTGKTKELRAADLRKTGMPDLTGVNIATINYESLEKFMPAIRAAGFDTIIVDESHRMKSPKAKVTKAIQSMKAIFPHKILLSGTAIKNKKDELHTQIDFIKPGMFTRAELKMGTIGGVWNKLRDVYIARQKKLVLKDLPDKTTQITHVAVPGMPAMPRDIGEMSSTRVEAALAKAPVTVEFVKEVLDSSDSSVLVFSESKEAAEKMAAELGDVAILHHGQMSDDAREAAKKEFQREGTPKRVFVSTRQSLAVGATLTAADKVVFNDLPWTAADLRQAEDRAHRIGQKNAVNIYWITASGNEWDSNVAEIIKRKYELNRKLNEGKQLSAAEREWMEKPVSLDDVKAAIAGRSPVVAKSFYIVEPLVKSELFVITETQFFISEMLKSSTGMERPGHKYIRRYKSPVDGSWIYVYHEGSGRGRQIPEEAVEHIKKMAEAGHHVARQIHSTISDHDEAHLNELRQRARGTDQHASDAAEAKEKLKHYGIDHEKEDKELAKKHEAKEVERRILAERDRRKAEEAARQETRRQAHPQRRDLTPARSHEIDQLISSAVQAKVFGYLAQYPREAYTTKLAEHGVTVASVMASVQAEKTIEGKLKALRESVAKIDQAHEGLPTSQNHDARNAGGYGKLAYNAAVKSLVDSENMPASLSHPFAVTPDFDAHHDAAVTHEAGAAARREAIAERARQEAARQAERTRLEAEREAERTRRAAERQAEEERANAAAAGTLEGSMANFMAGLYGEGQMRTNEKLALHRALTNIFGTNMRKEDWPYDFSASGCTVKIEGLSVGSEGKSINMRLVVMKGNDRITTGWERSWSLDPSGGVRIYNAFLKTDWHQRHHGVKVGSLVNKGQMKMMKKFSPGKGQVRVHANCDVGGYNWANQGFDFETADDRRHIVEGFANHLRNYGINLTSAEKALFTKPCHVSAFTDGKLYLKYVSDPVDLTDQQKAAGTLSGIPGDNQFKLTPQEISDGHAKRIACHLGKHFLLGNSWHGELKTTNMKESNVAYQFFMKYAEMRDQAYKLLGPEYEAVVARAKSGAQPTAAAARASAPGEASMHYITEPRAASGRVRAGTAAPGNFRMPPGWRTGRGRTETAPLRVMSLLAEHGHQMTPAQFRQAHEALAEAHNQRLEMARTHFAVSPTESFTTYQQEINRSPTGDSYAVGGDHYRTLNEAVHGAYEKAFQSRVSSHSASRDVMEPPLRRRRRRAA